MPALHFTNLLVVVAAGLVAPLALGFFPRVRIPAIVLEIVLGIVIGPSVLGWVEPDLPVARPRVVSADVAAAAYRTTVAGPDGTHFARLFQRLHGRDGFAM